MCFGCPWFQSWGQNSNYWLWTPHFCKCSSILSGLSWLWSQIRDGVLITIYRNDFMRIYAIKCEEILFCIVKWHFEVSFIPERPSWRQVLLLTVRHELSVRKQHWFILLSIKQEWIHNWAYVIIKEFKYIQACSMVVIVCYNQWMEGRNELTAVSLI